MPWGISPGPAQLFSVDGALSAIDIWFESTPEQPETQFERDLMRAVRDRLDMIPDVPKPKDLEAAERALREMAQYSRSREAEYARIDAHVAALNANGRRPRAGL